MCSRPQNRHAPATHTCFCPGPCVPPAPQYLKSRLEKLEGDLQAERESRKRVEEDLASLRNSMRR